MKTIKIEEAVDCNLWATRFGRGWTCRMRDYRMDV